MLWKESAGAEVLAYFAAGKPEFAQVRTNSGITNLVVQIHCHTVKNLNQLMKK